MTPDPRLAALSAAWHDLLAPLNVARARGQVDVEATIEREMAEIAATHDRLRREDWARRFPLRMVG